MKPTSHIRNYLKLLVFLAVFSGVFGASIMRADALSDAQKIKYANWHPQKIAPGIVFKQAHFEDLFGAPQSISVVEVDLNRKKTILGIAADPQRRIATSEFARQKDAIVALNGTFFDMKNGGSVMFVKSADQVINTTKVRSERGGGAITFDGNHATIVAADPQDDKWEEHLSAPEVMVSGPVLMLDGKAVELSQKAFNRLSHPRSAVAITRDCKLLLIAVDGRNKQAGGMSLFSLTSLLENLNACSALNLDGGGSTALYVKGQTETGIVSYPSDNGKFDHAGERRVANVIWIGRK